MHEKFKNLILFAGVDRKEYEETVIPRSNEDNRIMVNTVSFLAVILITAMFISAMFVEGVRMNQTAYGIGALVSFALFLTSVLFTKRYSVLIMPLVYISYFIFFTYGIIIGTITDPDQKTVTFMVMLVFLPMLFVHRPIHSVLVIVIHVFVFIVLCLKYKTGNVLGNDIIDAIIFGILGMTSGTIVARIKVKGYIMEAQLKKVSRIDKLTELNNRNAYELDLYTIPEQCDHSLSCVYVDANGLKRLNDIRGHKYGDELLKCIARSIVEVFGKKYSYRFGGDEFVIFIPDCDDIKAEVRILVADIESKGYHISVGWDSCKIDRLSMTTLIHNAETMMYKKKAEYYRKEKNDRRNRM